MSDILNRWALHIAKENQKELDRGWITTPIQEATEYRIFLRDCQSEGLTKDEAEDIWFKASILANKIDVTSK